MGEISVGPALLLVFKSWRQSVNANIQAVPLKLFIMKSPSNAAQKKFLRASRRFAVFNPAPARGGLDAFPEPWIFLSDLFLFCTRTREKNSFLYRN